MSQDSHMNTVLCSMFTTFLNGENKVTGLLGCRSAYNVLTGRKRAPTDAALFSTDACSLDSLLFEQLAL